MTKGVHPKKEIREAIAYAKGLGWTVHPGGSYRWGIIWCPAHEHFVNIKSTPQSPSNHGNQIRRAVDRDHCESKPKEA